MIDALNSLITRAKRSQRVVPHGDPVKVNVGSYLLVEPGWINVEGTVHALLAHKAEFLARLMYRHSHVSDVLGSEEEYVGILQNHEFVHHDLAYGLPFPDGSVDFIYASHVLEHFYPEAARHLLRESHRVLKPGGRARFCVPDLRHAVALYEQGNRSEALEYFFQGPSVAPFHRHKYMYDFEGLREALEQAGFISVERCAFQQGRVPDVDKLDNRPGETLFVEAVKRSLSRGPGGAAS
jgi:SAM-dependent methyltransferase